MKPLIAQFGAHEFLGGCSNSLFGSHTSFGSRLRQLGKMCWIVSYQCVRRALARVRKDERFRVCHVSIQGSHIHAIAEAESKAALSRGMQSFQISLAKQLNNALGRSCQATRKVTPSRH